MKPSSVAAGGLAAIVTLAVMLLLGPRPITLGEETTGDASVSDALRTHADPGHHELAAFYRINPATAAKGVAMLTDKGVLHKRRGIGMFVSEGARELLLGERRAAFADRYIDPLLAEARTLGLGAEDLADLLRQRAASAPTPEGKNPA